MFFNRPASGIVANVRRATPQTGVANHLVNAKPYFGGGPVLKQDEPQQPAQVTPQAEPAAQPTPLPVPAQKPAAAQPATGMMPNQVTAPPPKPNTPPPTATVQPSSANVGSGQMGQQLWQTAMGAMNNPSRYDADLVKQGAKVIEDTIARMRKDGTRSVGEWAAGRGLVGSSLEGERMTDMEGTLDAKAQEMLFNLRREQANTFGADRQSAFGMGLGTAGFNEGRETRLGNEDYRNRALDQDRYFGERGADRADLDLAGRYTEMFGPEVLEQAGIAAPAGAAPMGAMGGGSAPSYEGAAMGGDPMLGRSEYTLPVGGPLGPGYDVGGWNALSDAEQGRYFAGGGAPTGAVPRDGADFSRFNQPNEDDPENLYGAGRRSYFGN